MIDKAAEIFENNSLKQFWDRFFRSLTIHAKEDSHIRSKCLLIVCSCDTRMLTLFDPAARGRMYPSNRNIANAAPGFCVAGWLAEPLGSLGLLSEERWVKCEIFSSELFCLSWMDLLAIPQRIIGTPRFVHENILLYCDRNGTGMRIS